MVDLKDGVFLDYAEKHEDSESRIEVERAAGEPEREKRKGNREWERKEDGEWMNRALVVGGEDHVHEDDGEEKGPDELVEGALQLAAAAGDFGGVGWREVHLVHRFAQGLDAVGQGIAGADGCAKRDHALAIEAVDARRTVGQVDAGEIAKLDQPAATAGQIEIVDGGGIVAARFGKADLHVVVIVDGRIAEARDLIVAANH